MMNMPWEAFVEDYLVKELHACHLALRGPRLPLAARASVGDAQRLTEKRASRSGSASEGMQ